MNAQMTCSGCARQLFLAWRTCPFCLQQQADTQVLRTCNVCGSGLTEREQDTCFSCLAAVKDDVAPPRHMSAPPERARIKTPLRPEQPSPPDTEEFESYDPDARYLSPFREERSHGICYDASTLAQLLMYDGEIELDQSLTTPQRIALLKRVISTQDDYWYKILSEMFTMTGSAQPPEILINGEQSEPGWSRTHVINFLELHGLFVREGGQVEQERGHNLLDYLGYDSVEEYKRDTYNSIKKTLS